jgi:hypothetical protein
MSADVMPKLPVMADTQGRLRVTKAQRRDILAALTRSGKSLPRKRHAEHHYSMKS